MQRHDLVENSLRTRFPENQGFRVQKRINDNPLWVVMWGYGRAGGVVKFAPEDWELSDSAFSLHLRTLLAEKAAEFGRVIAAVMANPPGTAPKVINEQLETADAEG